MLKQSISVFNPLYFLVFVLILFANNGKIFEIYISAIFFFVIIILLLLNFILNQKVLINKFKFYQFVILFILITYPAFIKLLHPNYDFDYNQYLILFICSAPLLFFFKFLENITHRYILFLFLNFIFINLFFFLNYDYNISTELNTLNGPNILYRQLLFFYALIIIFNKDKLFLISFFILIMIFLVGSRAGFLIYLVLFLLNIKFNRIKFLNINFIFLIILLCLFFFTFHDTILLSGVNNLLIETTRVDLLRVALFYSFNDPISYTEMTNTYPHNLAAEFILHIGYLGLIYALIIFFLYFFLYFKKLNYFIVLTPFVLGTLFSGNIMDNLNVLILLASAYHK